MQDVIQLLIRSDRDHTPYRFLPDRCVLSAAGRILVYDATGKKLLEEHGISRKFSRNGKISLAVLTVIIGVLYIITIISAGRQGVAAGMDFRQLTFRFVIFFWMISIFDAVVLDWWMFTRTRIFGILIRQKTGRTPAVWSVEPQWDGKEIPKLIIEVAFSAVLAWFFLRIYH